ncbi:MBL fold metallo-hydrolase [Tatumella sp. OPLPL6]|uniref:MBL fold metallo-hydrolase n=1 Tax=Tatumella sp. OPLPL6 TaxID=1928657 RepID=UPI000C18220C|nr:MBL fold metallo-hydrolase [Tatumella sp. OPLPL6]PIJ46162.1 MBL fold metallo-hydrolase [Tatumella sp. OPLPL6]
MITLCTACGTSYAVDAAAPDHCKICLDERQYVPVKGQQWIEGGQLTTTHCNHWTQHQPQLFSLQTVPEFAIGQRAFIIQTPEGNILWDCIACLDEATKTLIHALGGLTAIALSHPHYYTTMQDWAAEFNAPIYLHSDDQQWIMRRSPAIKLWEGESLSLTPQIRLIRLGGHFAGGSVLHWSTEEGVLLAGDIIQVTPGADAVSFMWSYPNLLPLPAQSVCSIRDRLAPLRFAKIYGAFNGQNILQRGDDIVRQSSAKYLSCLQPASLSPSEETLTRAQATQ